jgi:hypothetical protein
MELFILDYLHVCVEYDITNLNFVLIQRAFSLVLELCTSPPLAYGFLGGERVLDSS